MDRLILSLVLDELKEHFSGLDAELVEPVVNIWNQNSVLKL